MQTIPLTWSRDTLLPSPQITNPPLRPREWAREPVTCSPSSTNKALPAFVWPLSFCWLRKAKNQGWWQMHGAQCGAVVPFLGGDLSASRTTKCSFPMGDKWPPLVSGRLPEPGDRQSGSTPVQTLSLQKERHYWPCILEPRLLMMSGENYKS